jgi:hypothetical protein
VFAQPRTVTLILPLSSNTEEGGNKCKFLGIIDREKKPFYIYPKLVNRYIGNTPKLVNMYR